MTDAIKIKLDTKELDRIAAGLNKSREQVMKKLAFDVEAKAKMKAPVLTGALRNSIYTETKSGGDYANASGNAMGAAWGEGGRISETEQLPKPEGNIVANVGPCVEYAAYVELGTSKKAARAFLVPAVEEVSTKLNDGSTWKEMFE